MTIYHGDCLSVMPALGVQVDTIITDPPYGLEFMGKGWDGAVPGVEFWTAALDVCKPGAMLLAFGGTRTFHRLTCAIEDACWEIRDCIMWLYGQGFPKSLDISKAIDKAAGAERAVVGPNRFEHLNGKQNKTCYGAASRPDSTAPATDAAREWSGYGTALKPAWEPIIVAMKPLDGTFAENAQRHGVAGLNIDGCRISIEAGNRDVGRSITRNVDESDDGWGFNDRKADFVPSVVNPSGRFPANLILDEEAGAMLDEQSGTMKDGVAVKRNLDGRKYNKHQEWGLHAVAGHDGGFGGSGGASRFFYTAKASRSERGKGNTHPTVKPLSLMRYLCRLTKTPTGGLVLDPFAGSGSTLIAASREGRPAIGIELDEGHCESAMRRLKHATAQGDLFLPPAPRPTQRRLEME